MTELYSYSSTKYKMLVHLYFIEKISW